MRPDGLPTLNQGTVGKITRLGSSDRAGLQIIRINFKSDLINVQAPKKTGSSTPKRYRFEGPSDSRRKTDRT
tara:strand:+ start:1239 stop:1454 length:216 start_codon:yes stop_codon:yes gene_type:complete